MAKRTGPASTSNRRLPRFNNVAVCVLVRRNAVCVTRADVITYCHPAGMKIE